MSDEKQPLVSVSDVFGVGKLANSPAAIRLVDAIVPGVGELFFPWRLRRNSAAQIDAIRNLSDNLSEPFLTEIDLDAKTTARVTLNQRRNQLNRESIAALAIEDMRDIDPKEDTSGGQDKEPDEDWVQYFWEKAGTVSNEDMQGLWARVLTREAVGHGISLRILDLLRTLSLEEAQIIERLSEFRVAIGPDHRFLRSTIGLLYFPEIQFEMDEVEAPKTIKVVGNEVVSKDNNDVDFRRRDLIENPYTHILKPAGIYLNTQFPYDFTLNWGADPLPIQIGDSHFRIYGLPGGGQDGVIRVRFGRGIGFSQVGWEIFSFAKSKPNQEYVDILKEKFEQRGLRLEPVTNSMMGN